MATLAVQLTRVKSRGFRYAASKFKIGNHSFRYASKTFSFGSDEKNDPDLKKIPINFPTTAMMTSVAGGDNSQKVALFQCFDPRCAKSL